MTIRILVSILVLLAADAHAVEFRLHRPGETPAIRAVGVVVPGVYIGCIAVDTFNTRAATGLRRVHAVACAEATTGEMKVLVLRKNGSLFCAGGGYVDPLNTSCATLNVCGNAGYYCLF
jgi:hypothetical protein